jgi:hypothetical protein
MSGAYVREQIRAQVATALPAPWMYVESINQAQDARTLPSQWYTLDFPPADDQRISLGVPALYRESGVPVVSIFTAQQLGDALAVNAAELVRQALLSWQHDATGHLRVLACGPPAELDGGDFRGAWYGQSVDVRYEFDRIA